LLMRRHWPTWPVESVRLGRNFLGWMCVAGLLGIVIALIGNWSAATAAYEIAPGFWPGVGMTLLALLYLPNIVIGAAAVLLGGEYNLGFGLFSLFNITNVELPPLPILAAAPNAPIPGGPFLLAIPAIVAVATVYRFVRQRSYVEPPGFTGLGAGVAALGLPCIGPRAGLPCGRPRRSWPWPPPTASCASAATWSPRSSRAWEPESLPWCSPSSVRGWHEAYWAPSGSPGHCRGSPPWRRGAGCCCPRRCLCGSLPAPVTR